MSANETHVIVDNVLSDLLRGLDVKDCSPISSEEERLSLELLKAQSHLVVLRHDLESQACISVMKLRQMEEENGSLRADYERLLRESTLQRDTFQKTLRTLKACLDSKDAEIRSLNESNSLLRSEMMENAGGFLREREKLERLRNEEAFVTQGLLEEKNESIQDLKARLQYIKCKYDKKAKKIKKSHRVLIRLKKELEQKNLLDEKALMLRRLLEQIDCID